MTEITPRITGNDENTATQSSSNDSPVVHTNPTIPNTYPPQPNAGVHVAWAVIAKNKFSDTVRLDTTLTNYVTDVPLAAQTVFNLWQTWANAMTATPAGLEADVEIHWSIRLDNPTAPPPSAGAWIQAKQHLDGHLSLGNVNTVSDIQDPIMVNIAFLQQVAKY